MAQITRHEKLGLRRRRTFQEAVVILIGRSADRFRGIYEHGGSLEFVQGLDRQTPESGELRPQQDVAVFGQDGRRNAGGQGA